MNSLQFKSILSILIVLLSLSSVSVGDDNVNGNLVENPGFEDGMGDWGPWYVDENAGWAEEPYAEVEFFLEHPGLGGSDSSLFVEVIEPGLYDWYILVAKDVPMETGVEYEMYLRAMAEEELTISVAVHEDISSGGAFHTEVIAITTKDSLYGPFNFIYEPEPVKPGIKIQFGEFWGGVWVDDVAIYEAGTSHVETGKSDMVPQSVTLHQNFPNPFNPLTEIQYSLQNSGQVKLVVYDLLGRVVSELVNENQTPGVYQVRFDGATLPSGLYFYELELDNQSIVRKMMLTK